jgi:hypothetical protein
MQPPETSDPIARRDARAGRPLEAILGWWTWGAVYIADRPGCYLATGMADPPSAAPGTVMRTDTLRRYAAEAGFRTSEVLPITNDFFRFSRLRP